MAKDSAPGAYDNAFEWDSVYGHALTLLERNRTHAAPGAIHLDVGCGYGRIAENLSRQLGLTYVGVDGDPAGPASLSQRGFEAHQLHLGGEAETLAALRKVVGDRPLASITMLDTLEHLSDGDAILNALSEIARERGALVVISVPNTAHADVAGKLLLGRIDTTDVGILDRTHRRIFTAPSLDAELRSCGLYPCDRNDTRLKKSDQHFPIDHPLLTPTSEIGGLIARLRSGADPDHADVLQLVRLCTAGPKAAREPWVAAYSREERPLLSVVIRTQGRRTHTLTEALLALSAQTDDDFEVVLVGHKLSLQEQKTVEQLIADQYAEMRAKIRFLREENGGRTRPLNTGFMAARGLYIAILDDDDLPFANWVEVFRQLHLENPGRVLRAACFRQDVGNVTVEGRLGLRSEGPFEQPYAATFDLLTHLIDNSTPPMTLAFPHGLFHDLGLRFDESLTTTEDWDLLMRAALLVGVQSKPTPTSIYRWWPTEESSRTVHNIDEWIRNHQTIHGKMDSMPLLLPPGSAKRLRDLQQTLRRRAEELQSRTEELQARTEELQARTEELQRRTEELQELHDRAEDLQAIKNDIQRARGLRIDEMKALAQEVWWERNRRTLTYKVAKAVKRLTTPRAS